MPASAVTRIAIAEDQLLLRKAMVELLDMEEDFRIVFEAQNGTELVRYLVHGEVDLVLTDLEMPGMDGFEVIQRLSEQSPNLPVVVLSSHEKEEMILDTIQAGAKGYLLKNSEPDEVKDALRKVLQQGFYFKEDISQLLLRGMVKQRASAHSAPNTAILTKREQEVLLLICQEKTNQEIADELFLSPRTVESYRKNMIKKVGAKNTVGLVLYAVKAGWVEA